MCEPALNFVEDLALQFRYVYGMANVFVSHRRADSAAAEKLATAIKNAGHKVWLDDWDIKIGDSIVGSMQTGLSGSTYLKASTRGMI